MPASGSVPSLVLLALTQLVEWMPQLVECDADLQMVPDALLGCLIALARRRGRLDDSALELLAYRDACVLDVSRSHVTDAGFITALKRCASSVTAVDVSRTGLTAQGLAGLAACPRLRVLRMGGCFEASAAAAAVVRTLLPPIQLESAREDSWEGDLPPRAPQLDFILWPDIDDASSEFINRRCPRIVVNPSGPRPRGLFGPVRPPEANDLRALDLTLLLTAGINEPRRPEGEASFAWNESAVREHSDTTTSPPPPTLSIAHKFRLAFETRDAAVAEKMRRSRPKHLKNFRAAERAQAKRNEGLADIGEGWLDFAARDVGL